MFKSTKVNRRTGESRSSGQGISAPHHSFANRIRSWRSHHRLVASQSIRRLIATPVSSMMTILVLAVAITLPAALNIAISNVTQLTGQANDNVQMSLYLQDDISDKKARKITADISRWDSVSSTRYISPQEAKASFNDMEGFAGIIDSLPKNPLPGVIVLTLSEHSLSTEQAISVKKKAMSIKEVASAKIDLEWLQKIHAILGLAQQVAAVLTVLLSIGVMLVVGNTIKLSIDNRREEIIVTKLVGATNAFVRRPFLYMGLWFGIGGALIALALISLCKYALTSALESLSLAYGGEIVLSGLGFTNSLVLLVLAALLGWLGAWLAASQHIRALEPR
ncbi:MAG: permease-like cell division protein FtsX [Pseudomonadales bacterium]|nr:permease-like cell division protein FtsX [Pseudomonadales bacterium]